MYNFNTSLSTSLWMGELDSTIDEPFISNAFEQLGEAVVKITFLDPAKSFGVQGNCCFVEFVDVDSAQRVYQRLNGKLMPGRPGKKFRLNPASYDRDRELLPEFSLYVGDLTWGVDDYALFSFFQKRYRSTRGAKVVTDSAGKCKGYGFVRFFEESDQLKALIEMQHMPGLGKRPIKVSLAKKPETSPSSSETSAASPYLSSYHGGGGAGSGANHYTWGGISYPYHEPTSSHHSDYGHGASTYEDHGPSSSTSAVVDEDAEVLEDPELEINVGKENREYIESSESFFTALETSRWQPLDNIMSEIPS